MGKIYLNLKNDKINYLEEDMVGPQDILLSDMSKNIVLISMNNIKTFTCFDPLKKNEDVIKKLIKTGYRPANKLMELLITQNYSFCPKCGEDIDINRECSVLISDAGRSLVNIVNKNVYPAKELICLNCYHQGLYYYDLYADIEDKNAFAQQAVKDGADIYVKYRYVIDGGSKNACIPIIFDLGQLMQLFNKRVEGKEFIEDFQNELNKSEDKGVISMLFNDELHRVLETEDNSLLNNMRVELKPIELGSYSKYITKKDFEKIQLYESIGGDQAKLLQLILG